MRSYIPPPLLESCTHQMSNNESMAFKKAIQRMNAMDLAELEAFKQELDGVLLEKTTMRKADGLAKIRALMDEYDITIEDLGGAAGGRSLARFRVRYRHPDDASLVWSGRGRRPSWVNSYLEGVPDATLDDLAV